MAYRIQNTVHAEKRARERGFTLTQVTLTVEGPDSIQKTPPRRGNHGGFIWLFSRSFERKVLVVVAEVKTDECWIATAYWN